MIILNVCTCFSSCLQSFSTDAAGSVELWRPEHILHLDSLPYFGNDDIRWLSSYHSFEKTKSVCVGGIFF